MSLPTSDVDPISFIEEIESDYRERHGASPVHISHWDPAASYRAEIASILRLPRSTDLISYWFTYEMQRMKSAVSERFPLPSGAAVRLLTNCSTASTISAVHWLRAQGVERLVILAPFYFSVMYACDALGVSRKIIPLDRVTDGFSSHYRLPVLSLHDRDALWVTNPVYSSGSYLAGGPEKIAEIADSGTIVVLDETLADPMLGFARLLTGSPRCIALHSPHKTLNINGLKFSCILGAEECEDHLEQWSDVLTGGLAASVVTAIRHFTSPNFAECQKKFSSFVRLAHRRVKLACRTSERARLDNWESGNFLTCYCPQVDGNVGFDKNRMASLIERTAAVIFPTVCSFADAEWGFGFRLNLTRYDRQFTAAFRRLLLALSDA